MLLLKKTNTALKISKLQISQTDGKYDLVIQLTVLKIYLNKPYQLSKNIWFEKIESNLAALTEEFIFLDGCIEKQRLARGKK